MPNAVGHAETRCRPRHVAIYSSHAPILNFCSKHAAFRNMLVLKTSPIVSCQITQISSPCVFLMLTHWQLACFAIAVHACCGLQQNSSSTGIHCVNALLLLHTAGDCLAHLYISSFMHNMTDVIVAMHASCMTNKLCILNCSCGYCNIVCGEGDQSASRGQRGSPNCRCSHLHSCCIAHLQRRRQCMHMQKLTDARTGVQYYLIVPQSSPVDTVPIPSHDLCRVMSRYAHDKRVHSQVCVCMQALLMCWKQAGRNNGSQRNRTMTKPAKSLVG